MRVKRTLIREPLIVVAALVLPVVWHVFKAVVFNGVAVDAALANIQRIPFFEQVDYWQDVINIYLVVQCVRLMLWAISAPSRV